MELKAAMKLANALANLTKEELKTVTTIAGELRSRGTSTGEPKAKRKYTKRAKAEDGAVKERKKPGPKPKAKTVEAATTAAVVN